MPKSVLGCSKDKGQYFSLEISLTNYSTPYTIHGWYVCFFFQLNLLPSYLASFIEGSIVLFWFYVSLVFKLCYVNFKKISSIEKLISLKVCPFLS